MKLSAELAERAGVGESGGGCKSGEYKETEEDCGPGDGKLREYMPLKLISSCAQHASKTQRMNNEIYSLPYSSWNGYCRYIDTQND